MARSGTKILVGCLNRCALRAIKKKNLTGDRKPTDSAPRPLLNGNVKQRSKAEKPRLAAGFFIANRKAVPKRLVQYFATIGAGGGVKSNL